MKLFKYHPFYGHFIFWPWNLLYFIWIGFLISEGVFTWILDDVFFGPVPNNFAYTGLLALCTPALSLFLSWRVFKFNSRKLLGFFYGVEVPILLFCLIRMFILREFNTGTAYLAWLILLAPAVQLIHLIWPNWQPKGVLQYIYQAGQVLLGGMGVYYALILLIHVIPLLALFLESIPHWDLMDMLTAGALAIVLFVFFVLSATLFFLFPFAIVLIYCRNAWRNLNRIRTQSTPTAFWAGIVIPAIILIGGWLLVNGEQPHEKAYAIIEEGQDDPNYHQRIHTNEKMLKEGLVNGYLANFRYLGEREDADHIEELYRDAFGGKREDYNGMQEVFNSFVSPVFFQGNDYRGTKMWAKTSYQKLFDTPLQREERYAINRAINATFMRTDVSAGLLDTDAERVLLTKQEITVEEHEGYADVELYEVYQNQSEMSQEIQYNFELPEGTVIVGMWLSDDDSIPKKYSFKVSPRGAAQAVYNSQVRARMDPSLLEQVGPRQFRLRAFPVLPKPWVPRRSRDTVEAVAPNFHLWLQLRVVNDGSDGWAMPRLLEKRNVYWSGSTKRWLNNDRMKRPSGSGWLPASLAAEQRTAPAAFTTQPDTGTWIKATPFAMDLNGFRPTGKHAVIVDGSYSMNANRRPLERALDHLRQRLDPTTTDLYLCGPNPQKQTLDFDTEELDLIGWGNAQPLNNMAIFDDLWSGEQYESLIFLTDLGSYELENDSTPSWEAPAPLLVWHVQGDLPPSIGDEFLETIQQSDGDAVRSAYGLDLALYELDQRSTDANLLACHSGYRWRTTAQGPQINDPRNANAARTMIERLVPTLETDSIQDLDNIHRLALRNNLVSAYSSMIVLVNNEQWQQLKEAESQKDRFNREVETGQTNTGMGETLGNVNATPEPETWLLLAAIGLFLSAHLYYRYKERLKVS